MMIAALFMITACKKDTTTPVITLNGEANININIGDVYTEAGASATDNVDTSVAVIISGSVDTTTAGTYTIHYNATDTAGNKEVEVIRTITVGSSTSTGSTATTIPTTPLAPVTPIIPVTPPAPVVPVITPPDTTTTTNQ